MTEDSNNIKTLDGGGFVMRGTWMCMTKNIGVHNNAFGGDLMSHLDEVCAAFSAEVCDTPLVVTKTARMEFHNPLKVGQMAKTYCAIESIGRTSLTITVEMRKYDVKRDVEKICVSGTFVFVRVDGEGESVPIYQDVRERYPGRLRGNNAQNQIK